MATLGWHLGPVRHMDAPAAGYDQATEDALLDSLDWELDGYRLFSAATLAGFVGADGSRRWVRATGSS